MNCADVIEMLHADAGAASAERREAAERHAAGCWSCRRAQHAVATLRAEQAPPAPPPGAATRAVERALAAAAAAAAAPAAPQRGFWLGVAVGGAAAAALVVGVAVWVAGGAARSAGTAPQIALAPDESRDVNVALTSTEPLAGVEIHVVLTGAIGLRGYDAQELRWLTDLDRGVNELSLPVVALGPGGGQLTVEVSHGEKRRTFVVDVLGRG